MSKYIDADKLKTEVERYIKDVKDAGKKLTPNMGFFDAKLSGIYDVMNIVASLQQERPEVDLEKEIEERVEFYIGEKCEGKWKWDECYNIINKTARHFYGLGLNARKRE